MTPYVPPPTNDVWGAPAPPQFAALPSSQPASDPWGASSVYSAPPALATANGYGYGAPPPAQDPFGAPPSQPSVASNPYAPPPAAQDPFSAPAAPAAYGAPLGQESYAAPAPPANLYGAPPMQQQQYQQGMYGQPPPAASIQEPPMYPPQQQPSYPPQQQSDPFGTPAPQTVSTGYDYTPVSTIGFSSPVAQNAPPEPVPMSAPIEEPAQQWKDPALFSMGALSTTEPTTSNNESKSNGGSMADQAYARLVNMDAFELVKDKSEQKNPFEFGSASIGSNTASLADIKKIKSVSPHSGFYFCFL